MSQTETQTFLEDLLVRFNPSIDLTAGGRAQTEIITPILNRIGTDPFDNDVQTFVLQRIQETHPDLAITELDALSDTLIDPMRILFEAIAREVRLIKLRASIENVESLADQEVDALMSNFFESRVGGGYALGVVRAYFAQPVSISATIANPCATRSGLRFFPSVPQAITAEQMLLNVSGSEYYFDINYTAEGRGDEYNVEAGNVISVSNFPTATRISNIRRFRGGVPREDSLDYVARVQESQSDKTLTVRRGIVSEVTNNFPDVRQLQVIGFRDPEMNRDIVRGGGMGAVLDPDAFGDAFGDDGLFNDDLDGDGTTQTLTAATGNFISRIASVGSDPQGAFVTVSYTDPVSLVFVFIDARVLEVLSDTVVRLDGEFPLGLTTIPWAIRKRAITLSDIPGGITLPDTAEGELLIEDDMIHIGGKTDIYAAGSIDDASAQIESLTDEAPLGRGFDARTDGTDIVKIFDTDFDTETFPQVVVGMALVLEEGVDSDVYSILQKISTTEVRLNVVMTGTQSNLSWRIVDEIDTELNEPKEIKVEGSDMVVAAGNTLITTSGATNFVDANVQPEDVVRIVDDLTGGDYIVQAVAAVTLEIDPPPARTASGLNYTIFRRSEGVDTPVVRVSTMEMLDSAGAPTGTEIPYRDPVLAVSRSFQNESSGFIYDGPAKTGLVSAGYSGTIGIVFGVNDELTLQFFDPAAVYTGAVSVTITFSPGAATPTALAAAININTTVIARGARATVLLVEGLEYIGIAGPDAIRVDSTSNSNSWTFFSSDPLRLSSNSQVTLFSSSINDSFLQRRVRLGDVIEFVEGNNTGAARVLRAPDDALPATSYDNVLLGSGPYGPIGTDSLYYNTPLLPDLGGRVRVGRPSVGSARVYFLSPTSAEFRFAETNFSATLNGETLDYAPDPELQRIVIPAPPLLDLPSTGESSSGGIPTAFTDLTTNFLTSQLIPGDVIEVLYQPIFGTSALPSPGATAPLAGETLIIQVGIDNPFITIAFASDLLTRDEVVSFINEQVGEDIASLTTAGPAGRLQLKADAQITLSEDSTLVAAAPDTLFLFGAPRTNKHVEAASYIITSVVDENTITVSDQTPFSGSAQADTQYRIHRYVQRISSTEMNENQDETQLYFADVELLSLRPGDQHNIGSDVDLEVIGHAADGYRLTTDNEELSYSRAEILRATFSRSILIVGSSDSPEESVQLSKQNIQVNYNRSQTVDDIQSFSDADINRVINEEILVRHLFPHFVSLNWAYDAGKSEPDMVRLIEDLLDKTEPDTELEVGDFTALLRANGATSTYSPDPESSTERTAPILVVIHHNAARQIRGVIVTDYINTGNRVQRFLPGSILVNRTSGSAL